LQRVLKIEFTAHFWVGLAQYSVDSPSVLSSFAI
jgi:hypothetical protein